MTTSNPSAPKADALPGCATPRTAESLRFSGDLEQAQNAIGGKERQNAAGTGDTSPGIVPNLPPDVTLIENADLGVASEEAFARLRHGIPWKAQTINMHGRQIMQPRLTSWHADEGVSYTYSGRTHHPKPWTPTLTILRHAVEQLAGAPFNSVLLNLYPDERASIGFHSDDEPELGPEPVIASVSLGAERVFVFKPRNNGRSIKVPLHDGSVLVMRGRTQQDWLHGIPKQVAPCGERINLTFRNTAQWD